MDYVGKRVRVLENYSGDLNAIGKVGKVIAQEGDKLVLDLKLKHPRYDYYGPMSVIVKTDEAETVSYEFRDAVGKLVEIGDTIAYGPLGGGVTLGIVVDIKEREGRYNRNYIAIQVETDSERTYWDGSRRVTVSTKTRRWYDNNYRTRIVQKKIDLTGFPKLSVLPSTGDII